MAITDPAYITALESEASPIVTILLVEITHEDLTPPIRLTSDNVATVHNAQTYTAVVFEAASMPEIGSEDALPQANLQVSDPDGELVKRLRTINPLKGAPKFTLTVVGSHDTNVVQLGPFPLLVSGFQETPPSLNILLSGEAFLAENLPSQIFSPKDFPGLFGALRV